MYNFISTRLIFHIYLSVTSTIDAIFLVVGAFICSNKDSRFMHLASQKRTSVIGPGKEFGMLSSSAESLLNTFNYLDNNLNKTLLSYFFNIRFLDIS